MFEKRPGPGGRRSPVCTCVIHQKLLLVEEFFCAGIQFNGHTIFTGFFGDVLGYVMSSFHTVQVAIQCFHYSVTGVGIHLIGNSQHAFYSNSSSIGFNLVIGFGRNGNLGVVRILGNQFVSNVSAYTYHYNVMLGRQILDSSSRETGYYETSVNVAVFQSGSRFADGQVLRFDIFIGNASATVLIPVFFVVTI